MKFYGGIAIAIIALILLLMWLKENSESAPTTVAATSTPLATATPLATSNYFPAEAPPDRRRTRIQADSVRFANPTPTISPRRQVSPGCQALAPAAQRARVTVVDCREQDGFTVITVYGFDRNDLNNFLDEAMKAGIRDVAPAQQYTQNTVNGRVIYQNMFRFKF